MPEAVHPETSTESADGETWQHLEIADQTKNVEQHYLKRESLELEAGHLRSEVYLAACNRNSSIR
jgi:hypothetical protein